MTYSRTPGPLGRDAHLAQSHQTWCDVGCRGGHTPGPIRVADTSADKSKKKTKTPPAPTKTTTIILHLYVPIIPAGQNPGDKGFSQQDFIDWFRAPDDPRIPDIGKWSIEGIDLEFKTDTKSGVKDF